MQHNNPLLETWNTPYGLPPFDRIKTEHFAPALDHCMAEHKAELAAIASSPEAPSFANTIEAFDRCGRGLARVWNLFSNLTGSLATEALQAVEREYSPKLSAHFASLYLDPALFARVDAVHAKRQSLSLEPVQLRLLERIHLDFVLSGAKLDAPARARLEAVAVALSEKTTAFGQRVLADEDQTIILLEREADLDGLPADLVGAAAEVAKARGHEGKWAITVSRSFVEPFLSYSTRRELRQKVHTIFKTRGELSSERDTKPLIAEILALRNEKARILGYRNYAECALVDRMAKTPEAVAGLLDRVYPAALKRAKAEKASLLALARELDGLESLQAWDWLYYAEKLRKREYDLDESEVKPYFTLDRMVQAAFDAAGRLFGVEFKEVKGVPLYHEDARLFEMRDKASGELKGIFINDNLARPGKQSGAWMSNYRDQSRGVIPIVSNNNNITRGKPGEPVLLSFDDAKTLFHEFGHGLHGLLSDVPYVSLQGTNVLRDYVELPSQLFEHWVLAPEILSKWAVHAQTGKPIPEALVQKIQKASTFNMGWETVQYLGPALLDMQLHALEKPETLDPARFEAEACAALDLPAEVGLRHRLPHFQHLFSNEGYAAGYYVYMWAEVLDADAYAAFEEKGDLFDPELAAKLKKYIYSAGNSIEPAEGYRAFRGRDARIEPLLKQRGLS